MTIVSAFPSILLEFSNFSISWTNYLSWKHPYVELQSRSVPRYQTFDCNLQSTKSLRLISSNVWTLSCSSSDISFFLPLLEERKLLNESVADTEYWEVIAQANTTSNHFPVIDQYLQISSKNVRFFTYNIRISMSIHTVINLQPRILYCLHHKGTDTIPRRAKKTTNQLKCAYFTFIFVSFLFFF